MGKGRENRKAAKRKKVLKNLPDPERYEPPDYKNLEPVYDDFSDEDWKETRRIVLKWLIELRRSK